MFGALVMKIVENIHGACLTSQVRFYFISENMVQFVTDTKIISGYRTDHSGITLK